MTTVATPEQFFGTWKLQTMRSIGRGGRAREPYGKTPLGYITYAPDRCMHAILMHSARPPVGTPIEEFARRRGWRRLAFALRNLPALARHSTAMMQGAAYSARWEIRGDEVVHHVTASMLPDWIGTNLVRTYAFAGDTLTLTAHYPGGRTLALAWQKVPGGTP